MIRPRSRAWPAEHQAVFLASVDSFSARGRLGAALFDDPQPARFVHRARLPQGRPPHLPGPGASSDDGSNDEAAVSISQKQLNTLLAREKDQGGRAAVRALADKLGFANAAELADYVTGQRQAEQEQLSETQRREQELVAREKAAIAREAAALARERDAARRAVLSGVGASGQDL